MMQDSEPTTEVVPPAGTDGRTGRGFVSLTSVLEPWFERDRSELPSDLDEAWPGSRQAAGVRFLLSVWDGLSPAQRRTMAAQFDTSNDPANENEGLEEWDLIARQSDLEADLKRIEIGPSIDEATRQARRDALSQQIAAIDARLSKLATDARTAAARTVANEKHLTRWLQTQMEAAPNKPRSKSQIKTDAEAAGLSFSGRAFERVWRSAVISTGAVAWSQAGRKSQHPKSQRRIDTAV